MGMIALGPDPHDGQATPAQLWFVPDDQIPLVAAMLTTVLGQPAAESLTDPGAAAELAAVARKHSVIVRPDDGA